MASNYSQPRVTEAAVQACRHGYTSGNNAECGQGDDAFHLGVATASHNYRREIQRRVFG